MFESTPPEYNKHYIVVTGLENEMIYQFRIVAVDGKFESFSSIKEVETPQLTKHNPDIPEILTTDSGMFVLFILCKQ